MLFTSPIMPIGLLIYGWSAQYSVFWIVPIIGTALVGMGMLLIFMPISESLKSANAAAQGSPADYFKSRIWSMLSRYTQRAQSLQIQC